MCSIRRIVLASALPALLAAPARAESPKPDDLKAGGLVVTSSDGLLHTFAAGNGQASLVPTADLGALTGLAFGPHGQLCVTSSDSEVLVVRDDDGGSEEPIALAPGAQPAGVAFGPDGLVWVLDAAGDQLLRYNIAGAAQGDVALPAGDYAGCALAFGPDAHLSVTERGSGVLELTAAGVPLGTLGAAALSDPRGLAVGPDGRLYVADGDDVVVLDPLGAELDRFGEAVLEEAAGLALGPDGHVFVADAGASAVVEFTAAGNLVDTFGEQVLSGPVALAFVPWRYTAKIKGDLGLPGEALGKVKELDAVLSLLPGSGTIMIALTDDVTAGDDLASAFGASLLVLHGFEAAPAGGGPRLLHAAQAHDPALAGGLASIALRVTGDVKAGQFVPKKARGTLHRAGLLGIASATVKTGKAVD